MTQSTMNGCSATELPPTSHTSSGFILIFCLIPILNTGITVYNITACLLMMQIAVSYRICMKGRKCFI